MLHFDPAAPLVQLDSLGVVQASYALPWPELRNKPVQYQQGLLARVGPNQCAMILESGGGLTIWDEGAFRVVQPFVEDLRNPGFEGMSDSAPPGTAAIDVSSGSNAIVVAFQGTSEKAGRWLDEYDSRSGQYRGSALAPQPTISRIFRMAHADDNWYILHGRGGRLPTISAYRRTTTGAK